MHGGIVAESNQLEDVAYFITCASASKAHIGADHRLCSRSL